MYLALDRNFSAWPAQWRFCLLLGCRPGFGQGEGGATEAFSFQKVIRSYASSRPFYQWGRILQAFEEYYACLCYIRFLEESARKVVNEENEALARRIVEQGRKAFARSEKRDWPELAGLWSQKLLHLRYYNELFREN